MLRHHTVQFFLLILGINNVNAQIENKKLSFQHNDIVKVRYVGNAFTIDDCPLSERPQTQLSSDGLDSLNYILSLSNDWKTTFKDTSKKDRLWLEFKRDEVRYGLFINDSDIECYNLDHIKMPVEFRRLLPKKIESYVKSFINHYHHLLQSTSYNYGHLPMTVFVRHATTCFWGIFSRGILFSIKFYVVKDSKVIPIDYLVHCKKNGIKSVRRSFSWRGELPYEGTDDHGRMLVRMDNDSIRPIIQMSSDEEEQRLLRRYIPSWSRLSNQERMRVLDELDQRLEQ